MRIAVLFILYIILIIFYNEYKFPKFKIGYYDSNNTFIKPLESTAYDKSILILEKNSNVKVEIQFNKIFTLRDTYFFMLTHPRIKECNNSVGSVCKFNYNGKKEKLIYDIETSSYTQNIVGKIIRNYYLSDFNNSKIVFFVLGLLSIIILHAFMIGIFLKERVYIYYAFIEFTFLLNFVIIFDLFNVSGLIGLKVFSQLGYIINSINTVFLILFAIKFLEQKSKLKIKCIKLLYILFAYAIIDIFLVIAGIYYTLSSLIILPIIIYCAYKGVKQSIEIKLFLLALIIMFIGVIYIEFFRNIWMYQTHPAFYIIPIEAITMLVAIGFYLKNINQERLHNKEMLIHLYKEKSLSSVIASISHKYKNSLNRLSYIIMGAQIGKTEQSEALDKISTQIQELKEDTNNYLSLYQNNMQKEETIPLKELFELIVNTLDTQDIQFIINIDSDATTNKPWALKEIALIAITNSIEQLNKNRVRNKVIIIKHKENFCCICDNAGGNKNIDKLFNPNLSSKDKGSGVGLYIAKMISKNYFDGEIYGKNSKEGFCFCFKIA